MSKNTKSILIGGAVIIVVAGLWSWWLSYSEPTTGNDMATSTEATTTTGGVSGTTVTVPGGTVRSITENLTNSSRFAALFVSTGVAAAITGKGPYTIFAPTDAAFAALPAGTISNLTAAQLKRLVEYHVVVGRAVSGTAETSGSISTLSRDVLNFTFGADKIARVNNSILVKQYKATNGVVYVINAVLLPPASVIIK